MRFAPEDPAKVVGYLKLPLLPQGVRQAGAPLTASIVAPPSGFLTPSFWQSRTWSRC